MDETRTDIPDALNDHPHARDLARLRRLAMNMDSAFKLPIVDVRVGWDAILGLVPGVGDALALLPSAYIIRQAHRMGAPTPLLARMGINTGIDLAIGAIPVVGDLFDIGWKSKLRNVGLLEDHLQKELARAGPAFGISDQPADATPVPPRD
ncbi:DUF4112 domain-containing protein [Sulfitobacter aestuariivivens]|uniref:DUF4112 domain-containing protein n=1 Tax=Sulfitobacter aestuariivivens TaxID=2766981 RepID=A0A927HD79_9RHOB|nr:DUF4112 domain-containing protein [Sulfitobacter aestuariivivens]MBD3663382.1 DUF4112 domain-containing protein [Sulfitobacter aestuariivivens]